MLPERLPSLSASAKRCDQVITRESGSGACTFVIHTIGPAAVLTVLGRAVDLP